MEKYCGICNELLTTDNASEEHIIPNALGGRRVVNGFLCRPCNNRAGREWDAPLVKALQHFSILLEVRRDRGSVQPAQFHMAKYSRADEDSRGNVPAAVFRKENLEKVKMAPDGRVTVAKPMYSNVKRGATRRIRLTCRSVAERDQRLKDLRKKYPQAVITVSEKADYVPHFLGWDLQVGGAAQGRAITKAVLALAVENGVDAKDCANATESFKDDGKSCFSFFHDFDPIKNRVDGMPLHVVHVQGDPTSGHLIGYVELFGCLRFGVCLSTAYKGDKLRCSYAINPMTGEEVHVQVEFCCGPKQIQAMCEGAVVPVVECKKAIEGILPTVLRSMEEREGERVISQAAKYAFNNLDVKEGEIIEPRHTRQLTRLIMEKMTPYLIHKFEQNRMTRRRPLPPSPVGNLEDPRRPSGPSQGPDNPADRSP